MEEVGSHYTRSGKPLVKRYFYQPGLIIKLFVTPLSGFIYVLIVFNNFLSNLPHKHCICELLKLLMAELVALEKMSQEANKRARGKNPEQMTVVNSNSYVLNKVKVLKKKRAQCETAHLSYQMKPHRNFVMRMSPAAYELTKLIVVEELYSDPLYNNFYIESGINENECQNQVGSIFRIFNRKKDCSKGMSLKFIINFLPYNLYNSCQR